MTTDTKGILKCYSRGGLPRQETSLGKGVYLLEGPSTYMRYGGLTKEDAALWRKPITDLGFIDFEGGPFIFLGQEYRPGSELKPNRRKYRVIVNLEVIKSDRETWSGIKITTARAKTYV